jgi:CRISPR system Cascade subunit CasB
MQDPATFALFRSLGRRHPRDLPRVALCAAVLAGVREDRPTEHPARTLGPPSLDAVEQAAMKPLRFRPLIEAETPDERLGALRRAVPLADRRLNVRELAAACLDWSDGRRQRWIFEYYNAGFAAPAFEPTPEEAAV